MIEAENAEVGKPWSAHSSAPATVSANESVPQRSSATHQESGADGTTVRSRPIGISPPCLVRKYSALARRGDGPAPQPSPVSPGGATGTPKGAPPAKHTTPGPHTATL